jgi:hypothetical protein
MTNETRDGDGKPTGVPRRQLLKTVSAGAIGLVAVSGTASAHRSQFFGCSQVCTDTDGDYAVVYDRGDYECRPITRSSARNNLPWDYGAYCYEADWDEAIVGMIEENVLVGDTTVEDGVCTLCVNPNRCAENYYEDPEDIVDALNRHGSCAPCRGSVELGDDCTVYGSSGRNGDDDRPWDGGHDGDDEERARKDGDDDRGGRWGDDDDGADDDGDDRGRSNGNGNDGHDNAGNSRGRGNGNGNDRNGHGGH